MRKSIKLASIGVIFAVLLAVSAYATIVYYSANIPMSGNITAYESQLFRLDTNTQVSAIAWGNLAKGASVNTDSLFGFSQKLVIKNTGDYAQWMGWQLNSTLPTGVTLTAQYYTDAWYDLPQDSYNWNQPYAGANGIDAGSQTPPLRFVLSVASNAPRGAFTFNIVLVASDTQT